MIDLVVAEQVVDGQGFFGLVDEHIADVGRKDAVAQEHTFKLRCHSCAQVLVAEVAEGYNRTAYLPGITDKMELHNDNGLLHWMRLIPCPEVKRDMNSTLSIFGFGEAGFKVTDELRLDGSLHFIIELEAHATLG